MIFDVEPHDQSCCMLTLCPQGGFHYDLWPTNSTAGLEAKGLERPQSLSAPRQSPSMSQGSLSGSPIIHFHCRIRTNQSETKLCFAMLWISYATKLGQALAQWVASACLNNAKQEILLSLQLLFSEDTLFSQLAARWSTAERHKLWKMHHRAASYAQNLNVSNITSVYITLLWFPI